MKDKINKILSICVIIICIVLFISLLCFVVYVKKALNNKKNNSGNTEIIITKNYSDGYSGIYPLQNNKKVKEYNLKDFLYDKKAAVINFDDDFKNVMLKKDGIKYYLSCNNYDKKCQEVMIKISNNGFLVALYYNLESDTCLNDMKLLFYNNYIVTQGNKYCKDESNYLNIYEDGALIRNIPNSVNQFKYVHNDRVSSIYQVRIYDNRIHFLVYDDKISEKYISLDNLYKDEFVRTYNGVPVLKSS